MNTYYKTIGNRIKELRLKIGISQSILSKKIGVTEAHISKIENGKTMLSVPTLIDISNALQTTPDYLLFDNVINLRVLLNKEVDDLLKDLNQEQFKIMIDMIKSNKESIIKLSSAKKK